MTNNAPALRTRKPTGAVPWPLILVEGGEKSGKSWTCAEFTADARLGQAYWLDLGEGAADEYAAIPGADYLVLEHDGTYQQILGQVQAVHAEATRANKAGEKPVVLIVDSMSNEWDQLKDWVTARARESKAGKRALSFDPNAEVKPANGLWNDANTRHYRIMHLLMQFPGIVVVTARGKEVSVIGSDGAPVMGQKEWRVEAQKNLGYDVSAWVRLSRDEVPKVIGVRSVHAGVRPGIDKAVSAPSFTLAWLVFDILKCNPETATVRDLRVLDSSPDADTSTAPGGSGEQPPVDDDRPAERRATRGGSAGLADALAEQAPAVDVDALLARMADTETEDALKALWDESSSSLGDRRAEVFDFVSAKLGQLRAPAEQAPAEQAPAEQAADEAQQALDIASAA